jgi:hypothetical protein
MFSSSKESTQNIKAFFSSLPEEIGYPALILAILGAIFLFGKNRRLFLFLAINFSFTVLYASNYQIKDLQPYYLLAYMSFVVATIAGIRNALEWLSLFSKYSWLVWLSLLIPVFSFINHYDRTNKSDYHLVEDYCLAALNSLPDSSILISYKWDVLISPAMYYQHVEGVRKDVVVLDKELFRRRWYFRQMQNLYPSVFKPVQREMEELLAALEPFELGNPYNGQFIQQKFEVFLTELMAQNFHHRPVYLAPEILEKDVLRGADVRLPKGLFLVPQRYFYRLISDREPYYPLEDTLSTVVRFSSADTLFSDLIKRSIMSVISNRVMYELNYGKKRQARKLFDEIRGMDPRVPVPPELAE